jgi:aryl-alcohol dehydrogenase-like predicted oxidoreductase
MEYRNLGGSGCAVSAFALGTMTFGDSTDEAGAFAQLDAFAEDGGTLVDTADVYVDGASEAIIGRWLADRPADITQRIVLATKGRFPTSGEPSGAGLSRRHLDRALNASLRRLGVDTVDLYQVHSWDHLTPSRRPCPSSTTRHALARSDTSGCPTSSAGRSRRLWTQRNWRGTPAR